MAFAAAPVAWMTTAPRRLHRGDAQAGDLRGRAGERRRVAAVTMATLAAPPAHLCWECAHSTAGSGGIPPRCHPGGSGSGLPASAPVAGGLASTASGGGGGGASAVTAAGGGGGVVAGGGGGPHRGGSGGRVGGSSFLHPRFPSDGDGGGCSGGARGWAAVVALWVLYAAGVGAGTMATVVGLAVLSIAAWLWWWEWGWKCHPAEDTSWGGDGWETLLLVSLLLLLVAAVALPPVAAAVVLVKVLR